MNAEDLTFRRVLKPPGGEDSDIFGVRSPSQDIFASPRKVRNYQHQQSSIFSGSADESDRSSTSSGASTPTRRRLSTTSQERLFGAEDFNTPRRVVDRQKSSVFDTPDAPTPVSANKKYISRNPITGDVYQVGSPSRKGSSDCSSNGSVSPIEHHRPNGSIF